MKTINESSIETPELYTKKRQFRQFVRIDSESSRKIDNLMNVFYDTIKSISAKYGNEEQTLYSSALNFVNSNFYLTYDEKIVFLIRLLDPTLKMLSLYNEVLSDEQRQIDSAPKTRENRIISLDKEVEEELKRKITEEFGFYDASLIKYEHIYRNALLLATPKEKTTNVKINYAKHIAKEVNLNEIDLRIDSDELEEIIERASEYLKKYPTPSLNDLVFQLLFESGELDVKSFRNQLIFIIVVLDKNLRYKEIYENNYHLIAIKNQISQLFGCYYQFLMDLELKYVKDNLDTVTGPQKMPSYR